MPEGDSLHRAARRLQVLVGERLEAESPNPRGQVTGVASRVNGRRLESVNAVGKHLLLRFEGGVVVRSHLRMNGRWRVRRRTDARVAGVAVARPAQSRVGGDAVERPRARSGRRRGTRARAGSPRAERRARTRSSPGSAGATSHGSSARRSSTSGSSRGSGTCGSPRRSGTAASRPGRASPTSATTSCSARSSGRAQRCSRRWRGGVRRGRSIAVPAEAVRAAASRCDHEGSATPTARRTGARRASRRGISGEGGIRTLDERITTRNALAGRRLQPLGHLSRVAQDIGRSGRLPKPGPEGAATLCLPRRGAGAVERGGLENR